MTSTSVITNATLAQSWTSTVWASPGAHDARPTTMTSARGNSAWTLSSTYEGGVTGALLVPIAASLIHYPLIMPARPSD